MYVKTSDRSGRLEVANDSLLDRTSGREAKSGRWVRLGSQIILLGVHPTGGANRRKGVAAAQHRFGLGLAGGSPTLRKTVRLPNWERIMSLPLAHAPTVPLRQVTDTETAPYRYICQISSDRLGTDEDEIEISTGVLVGGKHVLTTAHSLVDGGSVVRPSKLTVAPGLNGIDLPFDLSHVVKIITAPGFAPGDEATPNDFALLETERDFSKEPGFWGNPPNKLDLRGSTMGRIPSWRAGKYKVNISGYPNWKYWNGQTQWDCYDDSLQLSASDQATLSKSERESFLFFRNAIQPGMSGSPVWITRSASLGGRFDFAITLGMKEISGRRFAVGRLIDQKVKDFISKHTGLRLRT